ncbi:hypothetical protein M8J77_018755 [Diaphorina citri]|nr:hypothetical protein M8J77_018755 [Diaphorina citri]
MDLSKAHSIIIYPPTSTPSLGFLQSTYEVQHIHNKGLLSFPGFPKILGGSGFNGNEDTRFATSPREFRVVLTDTVVLPCEVINPENYVLAWKRGIAILTAGSTKVTPDKRIQLVDGYNLQITDLQTTDAGSYQCQIGTLEPKEITHTLEILGK